MDIIALILVVVAAATFGGIVGWFLRGRPGLTVFICVAAPIAFLAAIAFFSPHEGYPPDAWVAAIFYDFIPFLFLAVPCVIGGVLMECVAYRVKQRTKHEKV
jgi:hypothetical protein